MIHIVACEEHPVATLLKIFDSNVMKLSTIIRLYVLHPQKQK